MKYSQVESILREYITVDPWVALGVFLLGVIVVLSVYSKLDFVLEEVTGYLGIEATPQPDRFRVPIAITFGVVLGWIGIGFISIPGGIKSSIFSTLLTVLILIWTRSVMNIGTLVIHKVISSRYDEDMVPILGNIWTLIVLLSSVGSILSVWNVNITPLLASAGVIGVVAGFAARDTIANFFGSISLYADETYRKGDFIELDEETRGIVWDISIRSTQIQTLDGDIVTIPNSKLNNTIIRNKAQPNKSYRFTIPFGVSYDANPEKVKEIAREIVEDHERIKSQPEPIIHLREFGDSSINFEILCYITHPRQKITVEDDVNMALYRKLAEEGIEIPYPQRDLHFKDN